MITENMFKSVEYEMHYIIKPIKNYSQTNFYRLIIKKLISTTPTKKFILKNINKDLKDHLLREYPIRPKKCVFFLTFHLKYGILLSLDNNMITLEINKELMRIEE